MNLSILHVSDLHFGDIDFDTGDRDPRFDAITKQWWQIHPLLDGLLGHDWDALVALADFVARFEEGPLLAITGDLTAWGSQQQFLAAQSYITQSLPTPVPVGLGGLDELGRIPGNHDHWPGWACPFGDETSAFHGYFPQPRFGFVRQDLRTGRPFLVAHLDSDADVGPFSRNRLLARGSFDSQLTQLDAQLPEPMAGEKRVLLIHHSLAHQGSALGELEIEASSAQRLRAFLAEHRFNIMLTGHTHKVSPVTHSITLDGGVHEVHELCCGTTTRMTSMQQGGAHLEKNSLLVHHLEGQPDGLLWTTELYVRHGSSFLLARDNPTIFKQLL